MRHTTLNLSLRTLLIIGLLLLAAACGAGASASGDAAPDDTPIPVEPDGGIGDGAEPLPSDDADTPIPVEPDGGIGDGAGLTAPDDTPIPVEPDGGIGDGAGPPDAPVNAPDFGVSSETDSLSLRPFAYCWSGVDTAVCADGSPQPGPVITADAQLVVTYEPGTLTASVGAPQFDAGDRSDLPVEQENPGIFLVDVSALDPGDHTLWLFWEGQPGDSAAAVEITIS